MENKVLEQNLAAIKHYDQNLADDILRINNLKSNFELFQNENGEYNLSFNGTALHSVEDAQKEAKKIVSDIKDIGHKNSIRVVYGIGLGYLADEFIQKSAGSVIIYEPNLEILRTTLELVEFRENLSKKNVIVCSTKQKLLHWIDILADRDTKITFSFLSSYLNLFKADIYACAQTVEYVNGEKMTGTNTLNRISHLASLNTFWAINKIVQTPRLSALKDVYKSKTALIASAGPSLAQNIETIKKNREKFVLFAAGPSLKLLSANNITPDFLCVVEPIDTKGQLEGIDTSNINLIFEPFSNYYLWGLNTKSKFLIFSKENFLNDWLARVLKIDIANFKSVGTVSYSALYCAYIMGFEKIIMCGQDLAYKDGQCYAKGSAYEALECVFNEEKNKYEIRAKDLEQYKKNLLGERKLTEDMANRAALGYIEKMNKTLYSVVGQDGKPLPTQACYAIFIKHFEEFAKNYKNSELINSSTGGAQINGFKNMTLEEALKTSLNIDLNIDYSTFKPDYDTSNLASEKTKTIELFKNIQNEVNAAINLQKEIIKEISRRKTINKNIEKFEEKITDTLNKFCQKFYIYPQAYFLCVSYTNRFSDNTKKQKNVENITEYKKIADNSLLLLEAIIIRTNQVIKFLSYK